MSAAPMAPDIQDVTPRLSFDNQFLEKPDDLPEKLGDLDELTEDTDSEKTVDPKPVSIFRLFQFATKLDIVLSLAGTVFSCAAGAVAPVMIIVLS
ncbi:hypothetical protein IW137_005406, partial [Coemansia sp. RSA 1287]